MPLLVPTLTVTDPKETPPAVNYVIAGGDPLATNKLYRGSWDGTPSGLTWTLFNTDVGNVAAGDELSTAGFFWWYVLSTLGTEQVVSNLVYMPVMTAAATAVQTAVVDAIVTRLKQANIVGIGERVYKVDKLDELTLGGNACVVYRSPIEPPAEVGGNNLRDYISYSIMVAFSSVDTGGVNANAKADTYSLWQERGMKAFRNQRLDGVLESDICFVTPGVTTERPPEFFDRVVAAFTVKAQCRERRGLTA